MTRRVHFTVPDPVYVSEDNPDAGCITQTIIYRVMTSCRQRHVGMEVTRDPQQVTCKACKNTYDWREA